MHFIPLSLTILVASFAIARDSSVDDGPHHCDFIAARHNGEDDHPPRPSCFPATTVVTGTDFTSTLVFPVVTSFEDIPKPTRSHSGPFTWGEDNPSRTDDDKHHHHTSPTVIIIPPGVSVTTRTFSDDHTRTKTKSEDVTTTTPPTGLPTITSIHSNSTITSTSRSTNSGGTAAPETTSSALPPGGAANSNGPFGYVGLLTSLCAIVMWLV